MAKRTARGQRAAKARTAAVKEKNRATTPAAKAKAQRKIASAGNVMKAEASAAKLARTGSLADLREAREEQMDVRAKRFKTGGEQTLAQTREAANQARAYADAMRRITGREMGERTPYTGGGIEVTGTPGVDQRVSRQPLTAFRDERFMAGLTESQIRNIDWMLREGEGDTVQDIRKDWRENVWDDTFNEATGRWERGDRTAALATQAGLLDQPLPDIFNPANPYNIKGLGGGTTTGGGGQHPYYAEDYTVPHMQTGPEWEGLGAEYQPGTVEGLSLLAGDPYTGYQPMDRGLLGAQPSFMGTPSGFTPMDFKGGLDLGGDTTTNTNNNTNVWGPGGTGLWHGGQLYTTPMSFHKAVTGG